MTESSLSSSNRLFYVYDQSNPRYFVKEPTQLWYGSVESRLNELVNLENGWDGYHGKAVLFENAYFTIRVLDSICRNDTPSPQIIPGVSGDLQIEWHTLKGDIELHVVAPNEVYALYSPIDVQESELTLTSDFTEVAGWVKAITETPIAAVAAAA